MVRSTKLLSPIIVLVNAAVMLAWSDTAVVMSFSSQSAAHAHAQQQQQQQRLSAHRVVAHVHKRRCILSVRGGARVQGQDSTTALHSVMVSSTLAALNTFWKTRPYLAAGITCGVKASAADLVAQKRHFKLRDQDDNEAVTTTTTSKHTMDYQRNLAFLLYGAIYQGMAQEFVYNHLYPVWFGTKSSLVVVLTKVLFDLLIQTTLVTLPTAYLTKAVIYRYSFREAMRRYVDDIWNHGLLTKYFLLWGPVQCLTFSIVPEHLRVTFIAFVSFFWIIVLSTIASRTPDPKCSLDDGLTCNIDG